VLGTGLTGMLLSGPPAALAFDPDLRISQYAHAAWRVRDGAFAGAPDAITQTTGGRSGRMVNCCSLSAIQARDCQRRMLSRSFLPSLPPSRKEAAWD
jgi:hypothetical protein